jgi:chromosome segregation ATPase
MTTDLASKMMQDREKIDEQLTKLNNEVKVVKGDLVGITKERKGEHEKDRSLYKQNFEQINSEISNLRNKLSEYPTAVCCVNTSRPTDSNNGVLVNDIHETTETSSRANTVETANTNSNNVCSSSSSTSSGSGDNIIHASCAGCMNAPIVCKSVTTRP